METGLEGHTSGHKESGHNIIDKVQAGEAGGLVPGEGGREKLTNCCYLNCFLIYRGKIQPNMCGKCSGEGKETHTEEKTV